MELVKKSNFGEGRFTSKKGIRKFRFGGNCSQAARFGVVQIAQLPECRGVCFVQFAQVEKSGRSFVHTAQNPGFMFGHFVSINLFSDVLS